MHLRIALVLWFACGCQASDGTTAPWWSDGRRYMVAADHPDASMAGAEVLAAGGNAVDAAVATAFALAVVRQESCGIGGGGFMMIHRPGLEPVVLDYRETAPAGVTVEMYRDPAGRPIPNKTRFGGCAVGVPGTVKGLLTAFENYGSGKLKRADVLRPAIRLARNGIKVDHYLHKAFKETLEKCEREMLQSKRMSFLGLMQPPSIGVHLSLDPLANTLERIAEDGASAFYEGPIARQIVEAAQPFGAALSLTDLKDYRVRERKPLRGRYLDYDVLAMPPPSSGGAVILQALNTIKHAPRPSTKGDPQAHYLVEAMKHAFANRARYLGIPSPDVANDVSRMIDPAQACKIHDRIDPDKAGSPRGYGLVVKDDAGTSHLSVVDAAGMAVACTESVNLYFGSKLRVEEAGFFLNNTMDDFAVDTTTPNAFGLKQSDRNLIRPGARPLSSMSPTIILKDGKAHLVVGASGGPRIITATLQTILNVLGGKQTVDEAVAAPRVHHQWKPETVYVQPSLQHDVLTGLLRRGHVVRWFPGSAGHVQAIHRTTTGWRGACDPAKGGRPAGK